MTATKPALITCLDQGFVSVIDSMGDDLKVVNAARISFNKQKTVFDDKDAELIAYLADHEHTAPFRHCFITFHMKLPIYVARQLVKHRISVDINEVSGRYVDLEDVDIQRISIFRQQATVNKQGSFGVIEQNEAAITIYNDAVDNCVEAYKNLRSLGVCKEQARMVLPLSMYTEWWMTMSLQAAANMVHLRVDEHAQAETQEYGRAVRDLAKELFPRSFELLVDSYKK